MQQSTMPNLRMKNLQTNNQKMRWLAVISASRFFTVEKNNYAEKNYFVEKI